MKQYAIIADDLTGAGDTGVQFARYSIPTRVVFGDWQKENFKGATVAAVNTETRALPGDKAYAIVRSAAAKLNEFSIEPLFKKIDSTLRGNIAVEIDAVADETKAEVIVFSPAFPENGRTVINGILLVDGIPVSRTPMGQDPANPITQSNIPELLREKSKRRIKLLDFSEISKGSQHVASLFSEESGNESTVFVCDAVTQDDLEIVTDAAFCLKKKILFAGAAGLGNQVAKKLVDNEIKTGGQSVKAGKKVLAIVGSVNPAAREQLDILNNNGKWNELEIPVEILVSDEDEFLEWVEENIRVLKPDIEKKRGLIIHSEGGAGSVKKALAKANQKGFDNRTATMNFARHIAETGKKFLLTGLFDGIIVTGGDIARALLDSVEATGLDVVREVSPGIPLGIIPDGAFRGKPIVTKAGGFGKKDALVMAADILQKLD